MSISALSNTKHELYAHYRALGEAQADCYMKAFGKQDNTKRNIWATMGCELEKDVIVKRRIEILKDWNATQLMLSRQDVANMYLDIYRDDAAQHSARVSAVNGLNKMLGFSEPIKVEISSPSDNATKTFASLFEDDESED